MIVNNSHLKPLMKLMLNLRSILNPFFKVRNVQNIYLKIMLKMTLLVIYLDVIPDALNLLIYKVNIK